LLSEGIKKKKKRIRKTGRLVNKEIEDKNFFWKRGMQRGERGGEKSTFQRILEYLGGERRKI